MPMTVLGMFSELPLRTVYLGMYKPILETRKFRDVYVDFWNNDKSIYLQTIIEVFLGIHDLKRGYSVFNK